MRSLLVYLKNYKKESVLAPLFKMLEASFELLVPLVMAAVLLSEPSALRTYIGYMKPKPV